MLDSLLISMDSLSAGWKVFFLSMLPISELRVSIPLGIFWGLDPLECFLWAVSGNFVPILPLLMLLPLVYKLLLKLPIGQKTIGRVVEKFRHKGEKTQKYGFWGLTILVAIPLPGTGVWTGSAVAFLFDWPKGKALASILLGELIAGVLVTLAATGISSISEVIYGLEYMAIGVLLVALVYLLWKKGRNK